jgi:hypothetical protein
VKGGKGSTAHFVWRCGTCRRDSSAKFETAFPPQPYSSESNGQFAPLVTIECRGLEFVDFDPRVIMFCSLLARMLELRTFPSRASGSV